MWRCPDADPTPKTSQRQQRASQLGRLAGHLPSGMPGKVGTAKLDADLPIDPCRHPDGEIYRYGKTDYRNSAFIAYGRYVTATVE